MVAPLVPKPVYVQLPPPELADQTLAIVGTDGQFVDSCRRNEKVTILYKFRVPKQSLPENVRFPGNSDRVMIVLAIKMADGKIVNAGSKITTLKKNAEGFHVVQVELKAPPMPPNGRPSRPGWMLQAKLMRDSPGQDPVITKEVPITLLDTIDKAPD
ncbi:MAG: hypothetical protein DWH91_03830 [Planctomycetota bacterium]|nr:MAG: hypothetical protein DWH91_03830 [Planctomycetota bacterium]